MKFIFKALVLVSYFTLSLFSFHPRNGLESLKLIERFLFYIAAREMKSFARLYMYVSEHAR